MVVASLLLILLGVAGAIRAVRLHPGLERSDVGAELEDLLHHVVLDVLLALEVVLVVARQPAAVSVMCARASECVWVSACE